MGPLKIAFSTLASPAWGIELTMTRAQQYGYDGVEVQQLDDKFIGPAISRDNRRRILQASQRGNMPIVCVATALNVAQPDAEQRSQVIRDGVTMMDIAASWSAPYMRVYAEPPAGADPAAALAGAREALAALAARGRVLGVAAVVETASPQSAGVKLAGLLPATPIEGVGALWDVAATQRAGEPWQATLSALVSRLRYIHLADGRPTPGALDDWAPTPLGEGTAPLRDILKALVAAHYDGWLTIVWEKLWRPELAPPEQSLPHDLAYLKGQLKKLHA